MAYSTGRFIVDYKPSYFKAIREIRERESARRDERAREMIAEMNEQRRQKGMLLPNHPLVCRSMKHLPQRGI